ncbi:MAG TPA: hypothetical protein VNU97_17825 [Rhizomicrobium sp.]|nr:hypothetical protein [Rhizomicrobium sp.]
MTDIAIAAPWERAGFAAPGNKKRCLRIRHRSEPAMNRPFKRRSRRPAHLAQISAKHRFITAAQRFAMSSNKPTGTTR